MANHKSINQSIFIKGNQPMSYWYLEWGLPGEALEDDSAKGPEVGLRIILQGHDHLWRLKLLLLLKKITYFGVVQVLVLTVVDKIQNKSKETIQI
jgi:hypothetical protein